MLNDAVTSRLDRISQKRRGKTDAVFANVFSNGCAGEFGTGGQQVGQADKTPKHSGGARVRISMSRSVPQKEPNFT